MNEYHFTVQTGKRVSGDVFFVKATKNPRISEKKALELAQGKYPKASLRLSRVLPSQVKR